MRAVWVKYVECTQVVATPTSTQYMVQSFYDRRFGESLLSIESDIPFMSTAGPSLSRDSRAVKSESTEFVRVVMDWSIN